MSQRLRAAVMKMALQNRLQLEQRLQRSREQPSAAPQPLVDVTDAVVMNTVQLSRHCDVYPSSCLTGSSQYTGLSLSGMKGCLNCTRNVAVRKLHHCSITRLLWDLIVEALQDWGLSRRGRPTRNLLPCLHPVMKRLLRVSCCYYLDACLHCPLASYCDALQIKLLVTM